MRRQYYAARNRLVQEGTVTAVMAPFVPKREAVLTLEQVAAWLQVGEDAARAMNLPAIQVGKNRYRYVAGQVLDELTRRAQ